MQKKERVIITRVSYLMNISAINKGKYKNKSERERESDNNFSNEIVKYLLKTLMAHVYC